MRRGERTRRSSFFISMQDTNMLGHIRIAAATESERRHRLYCVSKEEDGCGRHVRNKPKEKDERKGVEKAKIVAHLSAVN